MDARVGAINVSPVKSMALLTSDSVQVGPDGIEEDRRFYLIDQLGALLTQRQAGELALVRAEYDPGQNVLRLAFPDGTAMEGLVETGEAVSTVIWGRRVAGHQVRGDWSRVISKYCGRPVTLVQPRKAGQSFDEFPISILSRASVELLSQRAGVRTGLDYRRFRPNFLIEGCGPHDEDGWLGRMVAIGEEVVVRVVAPDPRCAITTLDPETGRADLDVPAAVRSYRPSPGAAYFGVYAVVERPGTVSLGDAVLSSGG